MKVLLPGKYKREEIIAAFQQAVSQMGEEWVQFNYHSDFTYQSGSVQLMPKKMGIRAYPAFATRKWWLFGERVRKPKNGLAFYLNPLVDSDHKRINVDVRVASYRKPDGNYCHTTDPNDSILEGGTKELLEELLQHFFTALESLSTA